MPIIVGNSSKANSLSVNAAGKKPTQSLTKYFPTLTGEPTRTMGWFNSHHKTIKDRFRAYEMQLEDEIQKSTNGDIPKIKYKSYGDTNDIRTFIKLTGDTTLVKDNVPFEYGTASVYLIGFQTITATIQAKPKKFTIPVLAITDNMFNITIVNATLIDYEYYMTSDLKKNIYEALDEITMQELFDTAKKYYFNTNITKVMEDMVDNATGMNEADAKILRSYTMIKRMQGARPLNAVQLAAFVNKMRKKSTNIALLQRYLLQFPELTFASLSQQFEDLAPQMPIL